MQTIEESPKLDFARSQSSDYEKRSTVQDEAQDGEQAFEAALELASSTSQGYTDTGLAASSRQSDTQAIREKAMPKSQALLKHNISWEGRNQIQQFALMRLDARMSAHEQRESFDADSFYVRFADTPSTSNASTEYVFTEQTRGNATTDARQFDTNNDGILTNAEFEHPHAHERNISEALNDGKVELKEFTSLFESEELPKIELELIFERFDMDRDGVLSPEEFEAAMEYIVQLLKQKQELKEEAKRQQSELALSHENASGAIGSKGAFIDRIFARPASSSYDQSEDKSPDKAFVPIHNSLQLASWKDSDTAGDN
ncbi:EF-hand domain-containing protein [Pelagicoccus sp. SDUM812003]|uniref:EF-hand domain-containing protein n=1 Tax=Pelagicoccus sp. SDUM812003 TaxID=3041267 RepID=UPI00281079AF|nr:EF-hand domain-containing protein [Pelagicoccus sp. SDUM812003]MDQ8202952.1 EF-hand domain-containing protein [Pelagicoccus sp. SDUM812003]